MQAEQQSERERLRNLVKAYGFAFNAAIARPQASEQMRIKAEYILDSILDQFAAPPPPAQGWKLVPVEPAPAMLDRAVAFALNVWMSSEYGWTDYIKDLWATMLAGSPPPPAQGGKG